MRHGRFHAGGRPLETVNGNGEKVRRDFSQKYTVGGASATGADLMNMLYASYSNPITSACLACP